jgi:hypothetical protein
MRRKALPLLGQVLRWGLTEGLLSSCRCGRVGQQLPGTLALQRPLRLPLLAGGPQQAAPRLTKVAFELVLGPRQARDLIAVEETGPIAPAHCIEVPAKRGEGWGSLWLALYRVKRAAEMASRAESVRCISR